MSDVEAYKGKLTPVDLKGLDINNYIKTYLVPEIKALGSYYSSWVELMEEELEHKYFYDENSGVLYKIIKEEELVTDGFVTMHENQDGSYDYVLSFYNGATGFNDTIREGMSQ